MRALVLKLIQIVRIMPSNSPPIWKVFVGGTIFFSVFFLLACSSPLQVGLSLFFLGPFFILCVVKHLNDRDDPRRVKPPPDDEP